MAYFDNAADWSGQDTALEPADNPPPATPAPQGDAQRIQNDIMGQRAQLRTAQQQQRMSGAQFASQGLEPAPTTPSLPLPKVPQSSTWNNSSVVPQEPSAAFTIPGLTQPQGAGDAGGAHNAVSAGATPAPAIPGLAEPTSPEPTTGISNFAQRTAITAEHGLERGLEGISRFFGMTGFADYVKETADRNAKVLSGQPVVGTTGKPEQLAPLSGAANVASNVIGGLVGMAPGIALGGIPGLVALGTQAMAGASAEAHDAAKAAGATDDQATHAAGVAALKTLPSTLLFAGTGMVTGRIVKGLLPLEATPFARAATSMAVGTGANIAAASAGNAIVGNEAAPSPEDIVNAAVFAAHGAVGEHGLGKNLQVARAIMDGTHPEVSILNGISEGANGRVTPEQQAQAAKMTNALRAVASQFIESTGYKQAEPRPEQTPVPPESAPAQEPEGPVPASPETVDGLHVALRVAEQNGATDQAEEIRAQLAGLDPQAVSESAARTAAPKESTPPAAGATEPEIPGLNPPVQNGTSPLFEQAKAEQESESETPNKQRKFSRKQPTDEHFDSDPVVSVVKANGGLMSSSEARKKKGPEWFAEHSGVWNDEPTLFSASHRGSLYNRESGLIPDEALNAAVHAGVLPEGTSLATFWNVIGNASKGAVRMRKQVAGEAATVKELSTQSKAFDKAAKDTSKPPVPVEDLKVGDTVHVAGEPMKVTHVDENTFDVTLEDGKKFGVQEVKDGEVIYGEHKSGPEMPDQFPVKEPPLPSLAKGGELLQGENEPFNLVSETAADKAARLKREVAEEKAKQEKAEADAKAQQEKDQPKLFADSRSDEPTKEERLLAEYNKLHKKTGFPDVPIADLMDAAGITDLQEGHALLDKLHKEGKLGFGTYDLSLASEEQKKWARPTSDERFKNLTVRYEHTYEDTNPQEIGGLERSVAASETARTTARTGEPERSDDSELERVVRSVFDDHEGLKVVHVPESQAGFQLDSRTGEIGYNIERIRAKRNAINEAKPGVGDKWMRMAAMEEISHWLDFKAAQLSSPSESVSIQRMVWAAAPKEVKETFPDVYRTEVSSNAAGAELTRMLFQGIKFGKITESYLPDRSTDKLFKAINEWMQSLPSWLKEHLIRMDGGFGAISKNPRKGVFPGDGEVLYADPFEKLKKKFMPGLDILKDIKGGIQSLLLPSMNSPAHLRAAETLGGKLGPMNQRAESSRAQTESWWKAFTKEGVGREGLPLAKNEGIQFMSRESTGTAQPAKWQPYSELRQKLYAARLALLEKAGAALQSVRENYFPGIWTKDSRGAFNFAMEEAQKAGIIGKDFDVNKATAQQKQWIKERVDKALEEGSSSDKDALPFLTKRPLKGSESFRKQKVFDEDIKTAFEFGLRAVSNNPVDIDRLKWSEMDRSIMGNEALRDYEKQGGITTEEGLFHPPTDNHEKVQGTMGEIWGGDKLPVWKMLKELAKSAKKDLYFKNFGKDIFSDQDTKNELNSLEWEKKDGTKINIHAMKIGTGKSYSQLVIEKLLEDPEEFQNIAPKIYDKLEAIAQNSPKLKTILGIPAFEDLNAKLPVGGRILKGYRYATKPVADVLNNYLSSSLYNNRYFGKLYTGWMALANHLNQFQLGVGSAFHAGFIASENQVSMHAEVMKDVFGALRGNRTTGDVVQSLKRAGLAPLQPLKSIFGKSKGDEVLNAWRNKDGTIDPRIANIVRAAELAGAGFTMERGLATDATSKMITDWYNGHTLRAAMRSPLAGVEMLARPIMNGLVPKMKAGVFSEMAQRIIDTNPGKTLEELTPEFRQAWNRIDARLGQVRYDRLFANNEAKNFIQGTIRAPGWSGGTIAELGGSFKDVAAFIKEWKDTGKLPANIPDRVAYTASLLLTVGITNALLTKLFTGEDPKDSLDYFTFKTGHTDERGNPERFVLPTYMKDVLAYAKAPLETLGNKSHPILSLMHDLWANKDYYGIEIRGADDNALRKAYDSGKYVAKAFEPFWMRGAQREHERGASMARMAAPLVGIMPAPKKMTQTSAEALADEYFKDTLPVGGRTQAAADASRHKAQLTEQVRRGEPVDFGKEIQSGVIAPKDVNQITSRAHMTPLQYQVKKLALDKALAVYRIATADEKKQLEPIIAAKRATQDKAASKTQRAVSKFGSL